MSPDIADDIVTRLGRVEAILHEILAQKSPTRAARLRSVTQPLVVNSQEAVLDRVEFVAERLLCMPWPVRRAQKWPAAALTFMNRVPIPQVVNRTYKHSLFVNDSDPCSAVRDAVDALVEARPDKWELDDSSGSGTFLSRKCPAPSPESGPAFWFRHLLAFYPLYKDCRVNVLVTQGLRNGSGFRESDFPTRFLFPDFQGTFTELLEEAWRYFSKCVPRGELPIPGLVDVGDWRAKLDAEGLVYYPGVLSTARELEAKREAATAARLERESAAATAAGISSKPVSDLAGRLATLNAYREDLASGADVDQYIELCSTWLGRSRIPTVAELTDAMEAWADGAEEAIAPLR